MVGSVTNTSTPTPRFITWVGEKGWRSALLLLTAVILCWFVFIGTIVCFYVGAYVLGVWAFAFLAKHAPLFLEHVYGGEVFVGTIVLYDPLAIGYYCFALLIIVASLFLSPVGGECVSVSTQDDVYTVHVEEGPDLFVLSMVAFSCVVPFLVGFVIGFW